jgi:hypothetical protein
MDDLASVKAKLIRLINAVRTVLRSRFVLVVSLMV